jgi:UDP-N-acetylglucosamine 2-epimerase
MDTAAIIVGTRPEAIKLAPVVRELRHEGLLEPLLVSTGQHREMLAQALGAFGLRPDVDLGVMTPGQTPQEVAARTIEGMQQLLHVRRPRWVVVQGDTTTAFAAAFSAFGARVPVAHVEAGLRSGRRDEPFPEEMNRRLVDQLSDVLFAPTATARDTLLREGFSPDAVHLTGNTVVDALLDMRARLRREPVNVPGLPEVATCGRRMLLVTAHRRESFGPPLESICRAILRILRAVPDAIAVYPVHLNPNVRVPVHRMLGREPRARLLSPVSYLHFVALMDRAHLVLTDSGGVQEEAPTFGKPILVLRDVTERPEGVAAGVARIVGTDEERISDEAIALLSDHDRYRAMAHRENPYGDGLAARRVAAVLAMGSAEVNPRARGPTSSAARDQVMEGLP